jgi:hypothetical protein
VDTNPAISLRWSAIVFAMLWTGWMVWFTGSFNLAGAVSFAVCGVMVGYFWYLAMRFVFKRAGLFSGNADGGTEPAPRGKPYRWVVWAGQMTLTGIATACLLNLISPFIPAGDWHWLLRSLFIILVWPALMWSLRPWMRRHLPA